MIPDYTNHAANERTFLAWVRTGVAIIALGFVIEKFNIFLLSLGRALPEGAISPERMDRLSRPLGHYGGLVLTLAGVFLIVVALVRFIQTRLRLKAAESGPSVLSGVTLGLLLVALLFAAVFSAYLSIG